MQSPDGKYIACGAIDGIIYIFEVVSEKLIHTLEGKSYVVFEVIVMVITIPQHHIVVLGWFSGAGGLVVEYRIRNFHVAGANLALAICKQP